MEQVTGDTEGLLGLFSDSFLNNGLGGSGCALGPKEGGKGRSCCCMAAIKMWGGMGLPPGFGWGGINPGGIAGLLMYGLLFEMGIAPPPAGLNNLK